MKHTFIIIIGVFLTLCFSSCKENKNEAAVLLQDIQADYEKGHYEKVIAGIDSLRATFPKAIEERKIALRLYQEASLKLSQQHLAMVDSTLQVIEKVYNVMKVTIDAKRKVGNATQKELQEFNELRAKRDSLKGAFDVECAKIKYIHKRQKQ